MAMVDIVSHIPPARIARMNFFYRAMRQPSAVIGVLLLGAIGVAALFADQIFPGDPLDFVGQPFLRPDADPSFPLGTDMLGRDLAAGIVHGARISLLIGAVATAVSLVIGTGIGPTDLEQAGILGRSALAATKSKVGVSQAPLSRLFHITVETS